ncbi:methyltransferase domain-containing protein [Streptomyces sp. S.PB5]|uniref:methyltransferase domain-containing protein n=1 Tax=Streptomyces sp. S.PB5 TaxID=3020844 RepID=UPI0025B23CE5|nr:methyltransferase domain-containing protein [Streptomyces sp. S.PB5]MDN3028509.1 methyltransferase domain-containing protein [Streptomyces sp. S.PB5]
MTETIRKTMDLPPGRSDVVHCSWVLHQVSEAEEPLRRMARALRPGGRLELEWAGAQPRGAGTGPLGILRALAATPRWKDLFAAAPPALHGHPADTVADVLTQAGLELTHYEPRLPPPFGGKERVRPRVRELAGMRTWFRWTWFAAEAEALGDLFDEFLDESMWALVEAGETDPHHARIVARRPV